MAQMEAARTFVTVTILNISASVRIAGNSTGIKHVGLKLEESELLVVQNTCRLTLTNAYSTTEGRTKPKRITY